MARLPDAFDLWVRKARTCPDPARQVDYVLGALSALPEWHFLNTGTGDNPQVAETDLGAGLMTLVFTDVGRIEEILEEGGRRHGPLPIISIPTAAAMTWCLERGKEGCAGLVINPGSDGVIIPLPHLEAFHAEWTRRKPDATGYWIPHLTTEEEDFWHENGL